MGLAAILLAVVMALEWVYDLDYSLGILYVLPVVVASTVVNRWQTILLAVLCAYARALFTPAIAGVEYALRFGMAVLAYSAAGLLIGETNRNRREILAAYARLKTEEDMRRRAEDQLRMLVESSPAAIMTLDHQARVLAANRAAHQMLGYERPGSLIGTAVGEHVPLFAGALRVASGGTPMRAASASRARRRGGQHFPVTAWFSTYEEEGQRRLAAILVDSSEEVREREHESLRHVTAANRLLAGAVAHEIRNLCLAVRVVISNLQRFPEVARGADFNALGALAEGLMRISAFELHKSKEEASSRADVAAVLEELRVVIEQDWSDIGGEIRWKYRGEFPEAHADPHALLQVFLNLSQNSLRAVQRGGEAILEVRVEANGDTVTITFEDSGPGVDDVSKLFKPFREDADGSGLGLYVSRAMLRVFDGELRYVPASKGCRFDVVLRTY